MRTHYCQAERDWITFEKECSWCGLPEFDPELPVTTDEEFRQMMEKLERSARPDITDD